MAKYVLKMYSNSYFFAVFNHSTKNKPEEDVLNGLIFDSKIDFPISESATWGLSLVKTLKTDSSEEKEEIQSKSG